MVPKRLRNNLRENKKATNELDTPQKSGISASLSVIQQFKKTTISLAHHIENRRMR